MAGFGSLGANNFGGFSGQGTPSPQQGYGIQPPTANMAPSPSMLSGGLTRSAPSSPAGFYNQQNSAAMGPDTSNYHQQNVAMGAAGLGNLGLQGYRGYPGEVQGTSYSNYGLAPQAYADMNAYMTNPLGQWQAPIGTTMDPYAQQNAPTNTNRYQMMTDTIHGALLNQWPSYVNSWARDPNIPQGFTPTGNASAAAPLGYTDQQLYQMAGDLLQNYGGAYQTLPPPSAQMVNIPNPNIPGIRGFA